MSSYFEMTQPVRVPVIRRIHYIAGGILALTLLEFLMFNSYVVIQLSGLKLPLHEVIVIYFKAVLLFSALTFLPNLLTFISAQNLDDSDKKDSWCRISVSVATKKLIRIFLKQ